MRALCKHCLFYDVAYQGASYGKCRRSTPMLMPAGFQDDAVWPEVRFEDWCGEFREDPAKLEGDADD